LLHGNAFRRGSLEVHKTKGMPCGKQHQDKCGYAIEQSSGHRRSNFCWIKFFGDSVYLIGDAGSRLLACILAW
jgi:hypothetical protein